MTKISTTQALYGAAANLIGRRYMCYTGKNLLFALLSLCLFAGQLQAQTGNGGVLDVRDPDILTGVPAPGYNYALVNGNSVETIYNPSIEPVTQTSKTLRNIITFGLIETAPKFINADFTATADLKIEYGHTPSSLTTLNKTFQINYKKAEGEKFNAEQYLTFDGFEYVKVTLVNINAPVVGGLDTREVLAIKSNVEIVRFLELALVPATCSLWHTPPPPASPYDQLHVSWDWNRDATGYNGFQLEWAWLENELESEYIEAGAVNTSKLFANNATRVDIPYDKFSYQIPLLYDGDGKLYYRLRAVNTKPLAGTQSATAWQYSGANIFGFSGHNNDMNWQATTSFAEEGKRKTVIQYFDGSLRGRQTVTKDNSTDKIVTAETMYDREGRAVLQILPTPGITSVIQHQKYLNIFNGQLNNLVPGLTIDANPEELFDLVPTLMPNEMRLSTASGTSQYYSPQNPNLTGINKNIPDAEGFPYTLTRYMPDATGRIMAQSGVGLTHQLGSGHETKYYYSTPAQEELDGLFGTEVGNFTHYSKTAVRDANGQISVSYTDMNGRTIATALAGESPANLQALTITNGNHYPGQEGITPITRNLLDANTNLIKGNSIESVSTLMVVKDNTAHQFSYRLNDLKLQLSNCPTVQPAQLCYDCLYDLEITITSDDGTLPPMVRKYTNFSISPDDDCSTSPQPFIVMPGIPGNEALAADITTLNGANTIAFSKTLNVGAYTIRKTLSINENSFQKYKDLYLSKALCKTEQQLIDSVYAVLLTTSNCENAAPLSCTSCKQALGTPEQFRDAYLTTIGITLANASAQLLTEISAAYDGELASCNRLCDKVSQSLPTIRQMMLQDMVPYTGQYAVETAPSTGAVTMHNKYNIFATNTPAGQWQPFYKNPLKIVTGNKQKDFYYNDQNAVDAAIHPDAAPDQYNYLNALTKNAFAAQFTNSWLPSLLPHHPEYDRLVYAEDNLAPSFNWITTFSQTDIFADAQSAGYLNPVAIDPFFAVAPAYAAQMTAQITNYQGASTPPNPPIGMWKLAYGDVACKAINNLAQRTQCYQNAPNTPPPYSGFTTAQNQQAWQLFRGLYAAKRNNFVNEFIATQAPLPANDEADLLAQGYRLWFPKNNQQIAQQSGWSSWWPPVNAGGSQNPPLGNPPGSALGGGPAQTYDGRCSSYINNWTNILLQCPAIAGHGSKAQIIAEITTGMQQVCVKGSDEANPYGASTVKPSTPNNGSPRSFEEVINTVLGNYQIARSEYCNPFVIEWPKPYGKNPPLTTGGYTTLIDSCNCEQFKKIKIEAQSANINPNTLAVLNPWLLTNYGETLTDSMFAALQKCNTNNCECNKLQDLVTLYHQAYPNGGYVCNSIPAQLTISSRTGNTPAEYKASLQIEFIPDFDHPLGDTFDAFITDTTACDSIAGCRQNFVNFFNTHYGYNPPLTWSQVEALYISTCGSPPSVCGYKDYSCETLFRVLCKFKSTNTIFCHSGGAITWPEDFTNFFNAYYHNVPPLSYGEIESLYNNGCIEFVSPYSLAIMMCMTTPNLDCSQYQCPTWPIILSQPQPMPLFLKCGYTNPKRCISCADISALTKEFKEQQFAAADYNYSAAPHFTPTVSLSNQQIRENVLFAQFINFRTGFQFNWLDYAKAAGTANPACNLDNYNSNTAATQQVICRDTKPLTDTTGWPQPPGPCVRIKNMAIHIAQELIRIRKESLLAEFENSYRQKCLATADMEAFTVQYQHSEYHYTLYYYDQAGNLVKTVPPKGVRPDFSKPITDQVALDRANNVFAPRPHQLVTEYRYNSLNQVVAQTTPDAGLSNFWYDALGRLVVSQNTKQKNNNHYSYTRYDALGRITEVGQKPQTILMTQVRSQDKDALEDWITGTGGTREQITRTVYDIPHSPVFNQQNLRNRVSYSTITNLEGQAFYAGTFYSYDIHGNVDVLQQDYEGVTGLSDDDKLKKITYEYDLISGKVNHVNYQPGKKDALYHRYEYDAENRLTEVATSRDAIRWERDAAYQYYKHGPLARTILGQQNVQGLDYAYTLQGWLKGVNSTAMIVPSSTATCYDMGQDGMPGRKEIARDIYGYALHYYDDGAQQQDYKPIGTGLQTFARPHVAGTGFKSLYNGNIAAMTVNLAALKKSPAVTTNSLPLFNRYEYDQLNRIVGMQVYKGLNESLNTWTPVELQDFKEIVSYDPNGNILGYKRNGDAARLAMDNMTYWYYYYDNTGARQQYNPATTPQPLNAQRYTNQLAKVDDAAADNTANYGQYNDIKQGQANNNYTYDEIGNLTADAAENISTITWNVYGKISSIEKIDPLTNAIKTTITYGYDAGGNRIFKKVVTVEPLTQNIKYTYYVRDAAGNVMSVYEKENAADLAQAETHLYGSSRLGLTGRLTVAPQPPTETGSPANAWLHTFTRGEKLYELSNHLGNVLTTITDRAIAVDENTDGTIDYRTADVVTANDYFPFGMQMPGRKYSAATSRYRYGFNGKENDNEVKGEGGQQDYGMRISDTRLGRFLSLDPLQKQYPELSPYQFGSNRPIDGIDQDGEEYKPYYHARIYKNKAFNITPVKDDPGARTYSIKEYGNTVRIYEKVVYESSKDAFGRVHHFNTYYFVEDKSIVNDKNTYKASGGGFKTEGTNWHYWMNDNEASTESKLTNSVANGIGTAVFGGAFILSAAPLLIAAAPTITNAASYGINTYGRDFVINTAKQYFSNNGDTKKMDWFDIGVSTLNPFKKFGIFSGAANETLSSLVDIKNGGNLYVAGLGKDTKEVLIDFSFGQLKSFGKTSFSTLGGSSQSRDYFWDISFGLLKYNAKEQLKSEIKSTPLKLNLSF